jgi:hypothetical protein
LAEGECALQVAVAVVLVSGQKAIVRGTRTGGAMVAWAQTQPVPAFDLQAQSVGSFATVSFETDTTAPAFKGRRRRQR